jgi:hypothetical protein
MTMPRRALWLTAWVAVVMMFLMPIGSAAAQTLKSLGFTCVFDTMGMDGACRHPLIAFKVSTQCSSGSRGDIETLRETVWGLLQREGDRLPGDTFRGFTLAEPASNWQHKVEPFKVGKTAWCEYAWVPPLNSEWSAPELRNAQGQAVFQDKNELAANGMVRGWHCVKLDYLGRGSCNGSAVTITFDASPEIYFDNDEVYRSFVHLLVALF